MAEESSTFVAREEDVASVLATWNQVKAGGSRVLRVSAPFGGGKRALVGEAMRRISQTDEDAVLWRVTCQEQENGLNWLVRMYGSLIATLSADTLRRGKVEMMLATALPTQPKRVQGWFQEFVGALKEAKTDKDKGTVSLRLPKDNPLIGLVEVVVALTKKMPIVLEIQSPHFVYSLMLAQFVEAAWNESKEQGGRLFLILHDEPENDVTKSLFPLPLLDLYERRKAEFTTLSLGGWGAGETEKYLASRNLQADAPALARIADGRPGYIAELVDILNEEGKLGNDLGGATLASLVPMDVDSSELDAGDDEPPEEGKRKKAGIANAPRVAYLAALLGQAFPSGLVADMGGWERDSIDDLVDAMEGLFEEVQFSQELGTWIYRFKRGSWREGVLQANHSEEGHDLARRVGLFMERFLVPRGYTFIAKTARVFAEHGAPGRAQRMRSIALSNDDANAWGLAYDLTKYFDEIQWPEAMRRTVYTNLLENLVTGGNVQMAERVHAEATEWATGKEDHREMVAWLLFVGSRLDARRQDWYRARDRARDALKLYEALGNDVHRAEIHNHLAGIELQDGNNNAAIEQVEEALKLGRVETPDGEKALLPGILAQAENMKGLVARRSGNLPEAIEHFRRANDVAGQAGIGILALDAGMAYGEALLASGQIEKARDALQRVLQIAVALGNPVRERSACELLAQAEGGMRNFEQAVKLATRTLKLTQELKFERALPIDLFNLGRFHYALQKPTEALTFFRQAEARVGALGEHPIVKELFYFMGRAHLDTGNLEDARNSFRNGLRATQKAGDWGQLISALDALASIEHRLGNADAAKKLLNDAIGFASKANLKDERKALKKKLDQLEGREGSPDVEP